MPNSIVAVPIILGETEKIKSVPFKYIVIFLILLGGAGLIFKFGFMNIIHNMNNTKQTKKVVTEKVEPKVLTVESDENHNNYVIIGIVDGHYVVKTPKGLKKVKISGTDRKNINDEIRIEKL